MKLLVSSFWREWKTLVLFPVPISLSYWLTGSWKLEKFSEVAAHERGWMRSVFRFKTLLFKRSELLKLCRCFWVILCLTVSLTVPVSHSGALLLQEIHYCFIHYSENLLVDSEPKWLLAQNENMCRIKRWGNGVISGVCMWCHSNRRWCYGLLSTLTWTQSADLRVAHAFNQSSCQIFYKYLPYCLVLTYWSFLSRLTLQTPHF